MTTAYAAVLRATDSEFSFEDVTLAPLEANELRIKVVAAGLCHTDLAVVHGDLPAPLPIVLGHEGSGIVEEVGSAVTGFAVGDHVTASFASCGHCANCLEGREAYCLSFMALNFGGAREDGSVTLAADDGGEMHGSFFGQSTFATRAIVASRNAVKLSESVPLEFAAPLGCGIQTGAGAVINTLKVPAGSSIVVSGTGAVGLSAMLAAKAAGATTVIALDVIDQRLQVARELGATHTINGKSEDAVARILEITDGVGAQYAIDTTAVPAVVSDILTATRFGASVVLLGVGRPDATLLLALTSGKTIIGAVEGDAIPQVFIPQMLGMYQAGTFPFDKLITTYPFDQIEQAIADTRSGAVVKAVLLMP